MSVTSIIITTHNRPNLLRRAVESAFKAGQNVEVVVVDDASIDETSTICGSLSGIKYVRTDHRQRVAGARNVGLLASTGEYLTFLDDDDLRVPESIDRQVEILEAKPEAGMIYGQAICADQQHQITRIYPQDLPQGDVFWNLLDQNFIPCGSAVFRRSCLERVGLLDDALYGIDDWDLWIRIAELFPILAWPEPAIHWRRSTPASGQGTSQASAIVSGSVKQFRECWMKLPVAKQASEKMRRDAWRRFSTNMAAHLCWETMRCISHRKPRQAAQNCFALSRLGPLASLRLAREYLNSYHFRRIALKLGVTSPSLNGAIKRTR